ncbi:DUF2489 domain-containing protein [Pseudomonas sp. TTU2014-080ASC]|uniref:DUF2489 domain-containing protein n=1 Tax=Pseudomonas sp. TTU2014-080ASC TaxID=1729724 RepID=UPI0007187285|nr:DUF2489 domain-containing protein [Pseudomonas sp. TTU2014-080ASC]KRW61993.1 hypothetical protein AO726_00770 [Pseudomonas sp. TTU2014-080ASC]
MNPLTLTALSLAAFIIVALAGYALHLWRKVWIQQRQNKEAQQSRKIRLRGDLQILASSLLDGQLPLIEGAIRIKVLLDNYDLALSQSSQCEIFQRLYGATAHIPTHQGWKALSREQHADYEALFAQLQAQHEQAAHTAARWLLEHLPNPHNKS